MPESELSAAASVADSFILWDVVAEHLDEAGFLGSQWEHALQSPQYTLDEVARTVEERMLAHLDGLVVGGDAVAERLLWPALARGTPEEVFAAAFALLDSLRRPRRPSAQGVESTITRLVGETLQHGPSLWRACELAAPPEAIPTLQRLLHAPAATQRIAAMYALDGLGALPVGALPQLLLDSEPQVIALALSRVGRTADPPAILAGLVRTQLRLPSPPADALRAAALLELPELAEYCHSPRKLPPGARAIALQLCALSANPRLHASLRASLDEPEVAGQALLALGFTGAIEDADRCVERLLGPLAALAVEAFVGITGVDLVAEKLLAPTPAPASDEEAGLADLDRDLSPRPEQGLATADAGAVAAWWQKNRPRFLPQVRYLHGVPDPDQRALLDLLQTAPMRRRSVIGLALALQSRGKLVLATQSLARRQQGILSAHRATTSPPPAHQAGRAWP